MTSYADTAGKAETSGAVEWRRYEPRPITHDAWYLTKADGDDVSMKSGAHDPPVPEAELDSRHCLDVKEHVCMHDVQSLLLMMIRGPQVVILLPCITLHPLPQLNVAPFNMSLTIWEQMNVISQMPLIESKLSFEADVFNWSSKVQDTSTHVTPWSQSAMLIHPSFGSRLCSSSPRRKRTGKFHSTTGAMPPGSQSLNR